MKHYLCALKVISTTYQYNKIKINATRTSGKVKEKYVILQEFHAQVALNKIVLKHCADFAGRCTCLRGLQNGGSSLQGEL